MAIVCLVNRTTTEIDALHVDVGRLRLDWVGGERGTLRRVHGEALEWGEGERRVEGQGRRCEDAGGEGGWVVFADDVFWELRNINEDETQEPYRLRPPSSRPSTASTSAAPTSI